VLALYVIPPLLYTAINNIIFYITFNPKYSKWYDPSLDLEHTIHVCRSERVNYLVFKISGQGLIFLTFCYFGFLLYPQFCCFNIKLSTTNIYGYKINIGYLMHNHII